MEYLQPVLLFLSLFLLTCLFCWFAYDLFLVSPVLGMGMFLPGVLGVVLLTDALKARFFP